ncbi:MAG: hypothetical protein EBW49_03610 [Betaproteobacteria bacterium]|nr:hypothetical protein [Betaproteobacteria bacterium]
MQGRKNRLLLVRRQCQRLWNPQEFMAVCIQNRHRFVGCTNRESAHHHHGLVQHFVQTQLPMAL